MAKWTADDITNMAGKVVLITGANSGLGLESARVLAGKQAHVIEDHTSPRFKRPRHGIGVHGFNANHLDSRLQALHV